MARRSTGPLRMPAWLVGPGLVVPPVFIALIACILPRPVAPQPALPRLEREEADRALASLVRRGRRVVLADDEEVLVARWRRHGATRLALERSGRGTPAVVEAHSALQKQCRTVLESRGVPRVLGVGDAIAADVVVGLLGLEADRDAATAEVRKVGGTFLDHARRVGLVTRSGRFATHPLVAAVVVKVGFRGECGLAAETGLAPVELAALDLFLLRFAAGVPAARRARAAMRFIEHRPSYPAARTAAAILLAGGERLQVEALLRQAVEAEPHDRALRNAYLHVLDLEARGP